MKKQKESWFCSECGHDQIKWSGSCSACKQWNTIRKFSFISENKGNRCNLGEGKPSLLKNISLTTFDRTQTRLKELDRVFGGGIVSGSLNLIGGDPGIGKSTLMLMLAQCFCKEGKSVLYVCGEESLEQTKNRADRIHIHEDLLYLYCETMSSHIQLQIEELKPDILIIDSVQIVYKPEIPSIPGSVVQVKEIAMECMRLAKRQCMTIFLVGHVTKTGDLAGPRILEHIVDVVLDFEGDSEFGLRVLRSKKNRFGPTDEVAIFQMKEEGLEEVTNPSKIFLQESMNESIGSIITPVMEGTRAFLVEIQALVTPSSFSTCARRASGFDVNRLALLLAVLEKRVGYHFHNLDVFVSVIGGIRVKEPAVDLAIILAIASSFCNQPMASNLVITGEVSLSGDVRSIPRIETRIKEAMHMGLHTCVIPKRSLPKENVTVELIGVDTVEEAIRVLLR